jgi:uncharacterized pyridoxal phosphate-containing UPF0001 family protein
VTRPRAEPVGPPSDLVRARIEALRAKLADLAPGRSVRLVVVTKGFGPEAVLAVQGAGVLDVGENYARELLAKRAALGAAAGELRWHHLGALHRRPAKQLAPVVDLFHGLTRVEEAEAIASQAPGRRVLVQLELSGRPGRRGVSAQALPSLLPRLSRAGVRPVGVMTLGVAGDPERTAAIFEEAAALARAADLEEVSMGMSEDFELAVAKGATIVRIGRAVLGPRPVAAPVDDPPPGRAPGLT